MNKELRLAIARALYCEHQTEDAWDDEEKRVRDYWLKTAQLVADTISAEGYELRKKRTYSRS